MNTAFPIAATELEPIIQLQVQFAILMEFQLVGAIRDIETIASGRGVRIRRYLCQEYGRGNWRKMKGVAEVMYPDGGIWLAELHWYEAHGIARRDLKVKHRLRRL